MYCEKHNRNYYEPFCPTCSEEIAQSAGEAAGLVRHALADKFTDREKEIERWLREQTAADVAEQRHLDSGTVERTYWHYGYLVALQDVQKLLRGPTSNG
jgi:hypothetical protein